MRSDYVLYKAKYNGRTYWRARFCWEEKTGKYLTSRNLGIFAEGKRESRREAEDVAEKIAKELKDGPTAGRTLLLSYLKAFWTPGSDYIEEQARVNKAPLSVIYIENNQRNVRIHISPCPLFTGLLVSDLS